MVGSELTVSSGVHLYARRPECQTASQSCCQVCEYNSSALSPVYQKVGAGRVLWPIVCQLFLTTDESKLFNQHNRMECPWCLEDSSWRACSDMTHDQLFVQSNPSSEMFSHHTQSIAAWRHQPCPISPLLQALLGPASALSPSSTATYSSSLESTLMSCGSGPFFRGITTRSTPCS